MKIGIDANEANETNRVGVHQYAYEIIWSLYRLNKKSPKHSYLLYLKSAPRNDLPPENEDWKYIVLPARSMWILTRLTPYLFIKRPVDIFFTPSHYIPPFTGIPTVCTIHDLGYLEFSGQFKKYDFWQLKYWTAISIFVSKGIITVSESARENIVRRYKSASKKIVVAYHGYDKKRFHSKISLIDVRRVRTKHNLPQNYILSIGTLKPSKNLEGLIEGYALLLKKKKSFSNTKLVIAGKKGWLYDSIFEKAKELNISKHIIFTDFIDEHDKPALISGASVLASPSYWEGFGMQVLEANACGVPAVVSTVASLPEVAGNAGIYINPYEPSSIAAGLEKALALNKKEYQTLSKKCVQQAKKFSWEKSGTITLDLFERVYKKK